MFHNSGMEQIDSQLLQDALLAAPGWARVGLTAPSEQIREAAASELVQVIVRTLDRATTISDTRQIALPL